MSSFGLELAGVSVALLGWALSVVSCALPMWRVSAFVGANIVTAQVYWEGLWMSCVFQSTGQMQCKVYDSMLALSSDLQAARALTVVAIIVGALALLVSLVGAKCTNCVEDEGVKARVTIASGAAFIAAALAQLVPASWSANTIVVEFYSPRRELGATDDGAHPFTAGSLTTAADVTRRRRRRPGLSARGCRRIAGMRGRLTFASLS
uniref:Claudin n=1 Tax=Hippocampus comes TaxID=109280 RepID=A0A3Q2YVR1_HIPCM